jgi:hypothetical protein
VRTIALRTSSKFQAPTSKDAQVSILKASGNRRDAYVTSRLCSPTHFGPWLLEFLWSLDGGDWYLPWRPCSSVAPSNKERLFPNRRLTGRFGMRPSLVIAQRFNVGSHNRSKRRFESRQGRKKGGFELTTKSFVGERDGPESKSVD